VLFLQAINSTIFIKHIMLLSDMKNQLTKKVLFILLIIVVLGSAIRLNELTKESLWLDEVASLKFSKLEQKDPGNTGFYYLVLNKWINVFGSSIASVRMLSVILDIFAIILIFVLSRKFFSEKVSLFAAFMLSTSVVHLVYAQEVRVYAMLAFLALVSYLIIYKIVTTQKVLYYSLYTILLIFINYLHTTGFLILFVNFILYFVFHHLLKKKVKITKTWLITQLIVLIAMWSILFRIGRGIRGISANIYNYSNFINRKTFQSF